MPVALVLAQSNDLCVSDHPLSAPVQEGGQPIHRDTPEHCGPNYCQNGSFLLTTVNELSSGSVLLPALEAQAACSGPHLAADGTLGNRGDALPSQKLPCCLILLTVFVLISAQLWLSDLVQFINRF